MQALKLPFNLYANMKVTSYRRDTGSHAGGRTIDLAPLISHVTPDHAAALYVVNFYELFSHMAYGILRINESKSCWHYHLQADPGTYHAGIEHYCFNGKNCLTPCGDIENIDTSDTGSNTQLHSRLIKAMRFFLDMKIPTDIVYNRLDIPSLLERYKMKPLTETFILFDEKMISESELRSVLDCLRVKIPLWQKIIPASPAQIEQTIDKAKSIGSLITLGALFYFAVSSGILESLLKTPPGRQPRPARD